VRTNTATRPTKQADIVYAAYQTKFEKGNTANSYSDKQGLVTVIFAVVLFMLGIVSTFHNMRNNFVITGISLAALI
jgi:hypothetical protein